MLKNILRYSLYSVLLLCTVLGITYYLRQMTQLDSSAAQQSILSARTAFGLGKKSANLKEPPLSVCNFSKFNLAVICMEGYYSARAEALFSNPKKIDLKDVLNSTKFNRAIATGLGYGLSASNKDINSQIKKIKRNSELERLTPYLVDGWAFIKYVRSTENKNFSFCNDLAERWHSYCYFGAGRAYFFINGLNLNKAATIQNENFYLGLGFASEFNSQQTANDFTPAHSNRFIENGMKLAMFSKQKHETNQTPFLTDEEYLDWLSCSNKDSQHGIDCLKQVKH